MAHWELDKRKGTVLFSVVLAAVLSLQAGPSLGFTFSGDLTSANSEIDGQGAWITPGPTTIHWEVTDNGSSWHYKYVLTTPAGPNEISHFIIEVSDTFGSGDFDYAGEYPTSIGDYGQNNGNPDIPGVFHGLKFDETSGTSVVVEFDSLRVPVWGDFYAKDGGNPTIQAWNEGFLDPDPVDPAASGSINNHILVPDTYVPEPATLVVLAVGLFVGLLRKRRA